MADLMGGSSGYQTGAIDTATTQVDRDTNPLKGRASAAKINALASAIIQLETILGTGTTLKGNVADLATRLAPFLETNGKLKDFSAANKTTFPVSIGEGGTGTTTLTDTKTLFVNGSAIDSTYGLLFHGPSSTGTGSTYTHEGDVTVAVNTSMSGIHCYTTFALNSSVQITIPAGSGRLIIIATKSISINGLISGVGGGIASGGAVSTKGTTGTSQPGGSAGDSGSGTGGAGGDVYWNGLLIKAGATLPSSATGNTGSSLTSGTHPGILNPMMCFGGAGGGGADAVTGGRGGASVIFIAPLITFGATALINLSGSPGSNGSVGGADGAGGGGSGNLYVMGRTITDNGLTTTLSGGVGGTASGIFHSGGAGANGFKQIMIYG